MPRLHVRIPLEIEVSKETEAAVGALGEVVRKARDAGLGHAIAHAVTTTRDAVKKARRRRR